MNLFPEPISGYEQPAPAGHHALYGRHPGWCLSDLNQPGAPVVDHGPGCMAYVHNGACYTSAGVRDDLSVEVWRPYFHGVYPSEVRAQSRGWVRIATDDTDDDGGMFVTAAQARSVAAALVRAADLLESR